MAADSVEVDLDLECLKVKDWGLGEPMEFLLAVLERARAVEQVRATAVEMERSKGVEEEVAMVAPDGLATEVVEEKAGGAVA